MPRSRKECIQELKELIEIPLKYPHLYEDIGVPPPRAIFLYGVTGIGKTYLIKQAAKNADAEFHPINLENISGDLLLERFRQYITKDKPQVLYLMMHNPENIAKDVISVLNKILDGETDLDLSRTIITGSAVRPTFPKELTRSGRFDRELHIPLPNRDERKEILMTLTKESKTSDLDLDEIAQLTRGYTPADLMQLVKTAARYSIRNISGHETIAIRQQDFLEAISVIQPTVLREFGFTQPKIKMEDIGGHNEIKEKIWTNVVQPLKYPEYFKKTGASGLTGILLYGPPGNGKTTIAKAIASEAEAHFLYINSAEFAGVSGSEKRITQLFEIASQIDPAVLFFDEADSFLRARETASEGNVALVNEFLTNMDGMRDVSRLIVIAATNFINTIDEAVLRPGRLELKIYVAPPDFEGRALAFQQLTKGIPLASSIEFDRLAELTSGTEAGVYSFADLKAIVKEASMLAARQAIEQKQDPDTVCVTLEHFEEIVKRFPPSIQRSSLKKYLH